MSKVEIYCDGACSGNPGPGGWGAVLLWKGEEKEISGSQDHTTNNRMEMLAAIKALESLKNKDIEVQVYTDSSYLKNGMTQWLEGWKASNWKNGKVKNIDLWQQLDALAEKISIEWIWVKGHSGNKYNELADSLATSAIKK